MSKHAIWHGSYNPSSPCICDVYNLAFHFEILPHPLEAILCQQAGVAEVAGLGFPVLEAAVVEGLEVVCDDEGDDAGPQALIGQEQAAHAAVAVMEGNRHPTNILLLVLQSWVNSIFT